MSEEKPTQEEMTPSAQPESAQPMEESAASEPPEAPETAAASEVSEPSDSAEPAAAVAPAPVKRELPPPPVLSGLIGRKLGMTHIFDNEGRMVPVTVLEVGPCFVVQVRTSERDGYHAAQIGFEHIARRKVNKPLMGIFKKAGIEQPLRHLKEFRVLDGQAAPGQEVRPEHVFKEGEVVRVTGISKGKGFAGVVKRYRFAGGPKTHGSMTHRRPLSSGATGPQRVFKNKPMPGRMGGEQVTVRGLTVVRIDQERNLMLIKGAVPGGRGSIVYVQKQISGE
ncbi:MAG: 50S ribosomal protein L3 [Armatimonadota bacterium]